MNPHKIIALALVVGGVSLCASFGARLSPPMHTELAIQGTAQLAQQAAQAALGTYCDALTAAQVNLEPACPGYQPPAAAPGSAPASGAAPAGSPASAEVKAPPTEASLLAAGAAELDALRAAAPAGLTTELAAARTTWIEAKARAVAPGARAKTTPPVPPADRLSAWFAHSGLFFLLGLAAVLAGAVLARRVARAEALGDGGGRGKGAAATPAVDFGALLATLESEVVGLAGRMRETPDSAAMRQRVRTEIEQLQLMRFEPLVAARTRLQARYGLAAYAEIFGPLSGAERRINRAWTALVDHHWPEASDSVSHAAGQLKEARTALAQVLAGAA